ncbi:BON domain-containing protein [Glaciecola sp. XM2]|uniref:BON domain-containing protein n=1 Tax=Glaciecola sp. XM2 TaxID=1914931 RepID=UPI001BDE95AE|nr:BON domain-containing protein [Glaciecola sp. XM2]MBT1451081.1 BON domain-containing protein [Glaciecola sp. XM2]
MLRALLVLILLTQLSGCVSVVAVGAAGTAAVSASDRRTVGTQIDDKTIEARVNSAINKLEGTDESAAISVHAYNGQVLLTGQANQQSIINNAALVASKVPEVTKVHNQIRLGPPIPATATMNDIWLGTKIRTLMTADENVPLLKLDLIVEDSEVFIMGKLTKQEATAAVEVARNVTGVTKVIRVMELTN